MDPEATLMELFERGITCQVVGDRLHCRPSDRLTDCLREAIRANKGELMRRVAFWQAMAETGALPKMGESWPEECFLTVCVIFCASQTQEALSARWHGLRTSLSRDLPIEAMIVLQGAVQTLQKGLRHELLGYEVPGSVQRSDAQTK